MDPEQPGVFPDLQGFTLKFLLRPELLQVSIGIFPAVEGGKLYEEPAGLRLAAWA